MNLFILFLVYSLPQYVSIASAAPTQVKIAFLEALAPKDTTSSERFQKEYEFAVQTGKDLTKAKLAKCGYEIKDEKTFYDASDTLQAMEKAKIARESNAWLIVGPRRSNHYLLVAKGAETTPSVSVMASSKEIYELGPLHLTLGQSNAAMAKATAQETKLKFKKGKYVSIVNEDCVSCVDFAESFDVSAKKIGLQKLTEIKITGEQPDLPPIESIIKNLKPDFVLIPNYSKVSAYLIGAIHRINPKTFFVGGDGWGDNKYGFVHDSPQLQNADGITVKGFPPADKGLSYFKLGQEILKEPSKAAAFPASGTAQSLLKTIESVTEILCTEKPKTKEEFAKAFEKSGQKYFKNPWGVSLFKLSKGEIIYNKTVR